MEERDSVAAPLPPVPAAVTELPQPGTSSAPTREKIEKYFSEQSDL